MPILAKNAAARASASGSGGGSFPALPRGVCCTIRGTLISAAWGGLRGTRTAVARGDDGHIADMYERGRSLATLDSASV